VTRDNFDVGDVREILETMSPFILREGRVYSCRNDIRISSYEAESRSDGRTEVVVEAGSAVIPCRTRDGAEAVLIGGMVIPFSWASNTFQLAFEPVDAEALSQSEAASL
jgi:hypothetical protein